MTSPVDSGCTAGGGSAGVREVGADRYAAAARTLAAAFVDDPVKCHLVGRSVVAVAQSEPFFRAFAAISHTRVFATAGNEAAAIWGPPGHWKVPVRSIVRNTPMFLRLYGRRFIPNLRFLTTLEAAHPSEPHYYLEFIGTDPAHQGKGHGSALLRPMLAQADAEGVGAYLESSKESNIAFYARFGFELRPTLSFAGRNAPQMWPMWRDPR